MKVWLLAAAELILGQQTVARVSSEEFEFGMRQKTHDWTFQIGNLKFGIEVREDFFAQLEHENFEEIPISPSRCYFHPFTNPEKNRYVYVTATTFRIIVASVLALIALVIARRIYIARKEARLSNQQG